MGGKGSGGHNRKSLQQHILEGSYRKDRHGSVAGSSLAATFTGIKPSAWLSAKAKEYFSELAPELVRLNRLNHINLRLFEGLCETLAEFEEISTLIRKTGLTIKAGNRIKPNPLLRVEKQMTDILHKLLRGFGMTPASRGSQEAQDSEADLLDEILKTRGL